MVTLLPVFFGHIIASILKTREQDEELPNPVVKVLELKDHVAGKTAVLGVAEQEKCRDDSGQSRRERVMAKLRTYHPNSESS
jgi:negative regulator of sigma E activity